jgi:hypothetical protein
MRRLSPLFHEDAQIFVFPALLTSLGERWVGRFENAVFANGQTGEDESRFMGLNSDDISA